ncbi:MAG: sensor hybrid histidine kinase [Polaromonas sp.]|nr:sensor hybrid histidine kinase [Polaromonas sp.]
MSTSLGAPQTWPNALKTILATILTSPQPTIVAWGPELLSFFNDSYRDMMGGRFDGFLGHPATELWSDVWSDLEPIVSNALAGKGSYYENMPLTLNRNGTDTPSWWSLCFMPLRDDNGAVAGVYCLPIDKTEKVLAEQQQVQAHRQHTFWAELGIAQRGINDPPTLMATVAKTLGQFLGTDCVCYGEVDIHQGSVRWHPECAEGYALLPHQLDEISPSVAARLLAGQTVAVNDASAELPKSAAAHQAMGAPPHPGAYLLAPLVKEGHLAAILFVHSPQPRVWTDSEQALVEAVAERTWASLQRLQAELTLREMNSQLDQRTDELLRLEGVLRQSQKLDVLGQLTSSIAHDFNNLLGIISVCIQLVRADNVPVEQRVRYMDRIFDTAERATKLTAHLLAFTRQEPFRPEVFDVALQVQSVVELVRPLLGTNVLIHLEQPKEDAYFATGDISQFETALVNLLVNAADAMNGKGQISIQVQPANDLPPDAGSELQPRDFVAISIADTGCGIPAEKLDAIFKPFFTTKPAGKGTGLGLSQVFGFAKESGGHVRVVSEVGRGSVFTLYLPRART